ncbi:MAG: hypothetical protein FWE31_04270 [Firmicutes bacterium]|nr:hypothetical protein [Bacillota bacterium]
MRKLLFILVIFPVAVLITGCFGQSRYQLPTGLSATYRSSLASIALPQGWLWVNQHTQVGSIGQQTHLAVFIPPNNRQPIARMLTVNVIPTTLQTFRSFRDEDRLLQLKTLEAIGTQEAIQYKLGLLERIVFETAAESLIINLGFTDAVVQKDGIARINILIENHENITQEQVIYILTILEHIAGDPIDKENVFIQVIAP